MLKRFILWDYKRGSWQYDVMVGIILAFIFLTPHAWFRDQPRIPQASSITVLPSEPASQQFIVEPELLAHIAENQRTARLTEMLQVRTGNKRLAIARIEPVLDSEGELLAYIAFARP
jgi:hypothetical protein